MTNWPIHTRSFKAYMVGMMDYKKYDIAIVGGGLSGALAALVLADADFTIALIDADAPDLKTEVQFDERTTALSHTSTRLMQNIDLWDQFSATACPMNDILVTDGIPKDRFRKGAQSEGFLHFSSDASDDARGEPLGWMVNNQALRTAMLTAMIQNPLIEVIAPEKVLRTDTSSNNVTLHLEQAAPITASLIIAADGRLSPLREKAGIKSVKWGYPQTAIICTVSHEKDHEGIAQEIFLPNGPFAILPLLDKDGVGKISSLVWSEDTQNAPAYLALPPNDFIEMVRNRFGDYLGEIALAGPVRSHPLGLHLATSYVGDRLALIGDAAHVIHPIAGQGFNLAVKDIAALRDVLVECRQTGLEIGHGSVLARYQRWRSFDTVSFGLGTDILNRVFSNDNPLLRMARSEGMKMVNRVDPLRRFFRAQAGGVTSGDTSNIPSLLR